MIELINFSKKYGEIYAVNNFSYKFEKGIITGIIGPNGAGKTTLLKALAARHFATVGDIFITSSKYNCSYEIRDNLELTKKIIGFVEEIPIFPEEFTVNEFLKFLVDIYGVSESKLEEIIESCSLEDVLYKKIKIISKGYKERLNFARALLSDSEILILDEPSSGLDPNQIILMRNFIKTLSKNKTIILSTHLMQEAYSLCDKIIIMNQGNMLISGTIEYICSKTNTKNLEEAFLMLTENKDVMNE